MFGRDFSLGRHNLLGIIIIIIFLAVMFVMPIVFTAREIIDLKVAYGGKIVKKGIIKIFSFSSKYSSNNNFYDTFYYLVIEDEIGMRKKRYCGKKTYSLFKVGDIIEKKSGIGNSPTLIGGNSPYNSDYNSDVPKEPTNKTGSF